MNVVFIETFFNLVRSHELNFKIWERSHQSLLIYSNFHILRSSSIRDYLPLKVGFIGTFLILVWSHYHRFKIWVISDKWLLRYSTFHILRSSSSRRRLPVKVFFIEIFFWFRFGPMSLCLKIEEDPIYGYWDIKIFLFWGHFPLEVVFHWMSSPLKRFDFGLVPWAYI